MLRLIEIPITPINEEVDVAKTGHNDTFQLWVTGTKPEMQYMFSKFFLPHKNQGDEKTWFNTAYNQNPPVDATGKKFFIFPPQGSGDYKYFWWRTKTPEFIEAQLRAIQLFIRDVNGKLAQANNPQNPEAGANANPKLDAFITKIDQVRDFIEKEVLPELGSVPDTREKIQMNLEKFIDELANAVSDQDLVAKVGAYLSFASVFRYSFFNTFLIYLQNPEAHEVLSKGDWAKLNMQPKSPQYLDQKYGNVGAIGLWVPSTVSADLSAKIRAENDWRKKMGFQPLPADAKFKDLWAGKKTGKIPPYQQVALDKHVRIAASQMKGFMAFKVKFNFLDAADVEQIPNTPVAARPSKPEWHTDEPDEIADKVYEATIKVIQKLGIKFNEKDEMGGSKGSSSQMGDINLLASNRGVGRASTAIHELGHALTHQTFLTEKHEISKKIQKIEQQAQAGVPERERDKLSHEEQIIKDAYWGRGDDDFGGMFGGDKKILELQAEGIAFVVLRYYGIDVSKLQHSAAYIALWRNNRESVKANLEIISTTAKGIITFLNEELNFGNNYDRAKEIGAAPTEEPVDEENLSFLYEMTIIRMFNTINEVKELKKLIF